MTGCKTFIRGFLSIAFAASMAGMTPAFAQNAYEVPLNPIVGTWVTEPESEVTIMPCEEGFCGHITKIVVPEYIKEEFGAELADYEGEYFDYYNQDPELRSRPIMNLQILTMQPASEPLKFEGSIYNPEDGHTYEGYLQLIDYNTVRLTGCVLWGTICQDQDWVRLPEPVQAEIQANR